MIPSTLCERDRHRFGGLILYLAYDLYNHLLLAWTAALLSFRRQVLPPGYQHSLQLR